MTKNETKAAAFDPEGLPQYENSIGRYFLQAGKLFDADGNQHSPEEISSETDPLMIVKDN